METTTVRMCGSCATAPAGAGGILCDPCEERIGNVFANYWDLFRPGTGPEAGRVVPREPAAAMP